MNETHAPLVWWHGEVVPWDQARIPVTALRGLTVFDGLRAYWRPEQRRFAVVQVDGHLNRLRSAAELLHVPENGLIDQLDKGMGDLLAATSFREDVYLRLTVYIDSGRSNVYPDALSPGQSLDEFAPMDSFISLHQIGPRFDEPISCVISSWQRTQDTSFPVLVKTGASYAALRLARVEAKKAGADQAILLNNRGMVAETAEAVIFMVRHGRLYTPPLSDGVLDSLTRETVIQLARRELALTVEECSITRSELYTADEVFICGTWEEIRVVGSIDGIQPRNPEAPISHALRQAYLDMCTGRRPPIEPDFVRLLL
ncbi:aminotransferase class IV [Saccharopolyspora sp. NPDC000995]